ncbi:MAG: septal ring lytic transglycosylase RlpA family protein [Desulfovibrionaceae bacterium]
MIYMRHMAFIVALLFGVVMCALPVEAASTKNSPKTSKTSSSSKVVHKKSVTSKKNIASKSSSKKHKRSSKKKHNTKISADNSSNSQQIWLERAAKSELQTGKASWYGDRFHGGSTASGESYDRYMFTAAHRTLPLGTVVKVTDEKSGDSVMVCINDRGPYIRGRVIDLSFAAAAQLGIDDRGVASVAVEVVSNAEGNPLNENEAFYVDLLGNEPEGKDFIGPFRQFADASVMQEVLRGQHPKAAVVVRPLASR